MEASERTVQYHRTADGKFPFKDWLDGIADRKVLAAVDARIARFRGGNLGKSEPIGGGVSENKIDYGPGYRLYYGIDGKDIVILLLGGNKSTQNADIKTAQGYWEEHKRHKKPLRLKEKRKK
jgi:putative addiction module killer protein